MKSSGISRDLPKVSTTKTQPKQSETKSAPKQAKTKPSGDAARISSQANEKSNGVTPNFGTWGTSAPGLRRGQSGEDVKSLQNQLNVQGAGLKADGEFGPKTEKALRTFQRRKGLEQDGVAGPDTNKKLAKGLTLPKDKFLSEGSQGSKVRGAQELMNRMGGELKTDGKFGPKTQEAVKKLQREHGLKEDGIIGAETLKVLNGKSKPADPKTGPKTEPKAEPQAGPKAGPKTEPKAEPQAGPKAGPKTEPKAEPQAGPKAGPKTEPKAEPQAGPKAGPKTEPKAEPQADPKAQPKADPKPEPKAGPKPEPKSEPKPQPKPETKPEAPKEFAYLKDNVRQALEKNGKLETLRKLPPEIAGMYEKLSPQSRADFGKGLSGSTFGISHREAFVSGHAMGTDVFSYMSDGLAGKVKDGTITAKDGENLKKAIPFLARLTPKQRDAIAEMFILQGG